MLFVLLGSFQFLLLGHQANVGIFYGLEGVVEEIFVTEGRQLLSDISLSQELRLLDHFSRATLPLVTREDCRQPMRHRVVCQLVVI